MFCLFLSACLCFCFVFSYLSVSVWVMLLSISLFSEGKDDRLSMKQADIIGIENYWKKKRKKKKKEKEKNYCKRPPGIGAQGHFPPIQPKFTYNLLRQSREENTVKNCPILLTLVVES